MDKNFPFLLQQNSTKWLSLFPGQIVELNKMFKSEEKSLMERIAGIVEKAEHDTGTIKLFTLHVHEKSSLTINNLAIDTGTSEVLVSCLMQNIQAFSPTVM